MFGSGILAMKRKLYLLVAGLVMGLVGLYIAGSTHTYYAMMIDTGLAPSINLSSDLRGMGGMLATLGAVVVVGAFIKRCQETAITIATVTYSSFVFFRSLSIGLDGWPSQPILLAFLIEMLLAAMGILLLLWGKKPRFASRTQ